MNRTNIYLDNRQLGLLRELSRSRGESVAALVRQAIDAWLEASGVRELEADEWQRRFDKLLERRRKVASRSTFDPERLEQDVMQAVREVRRDRAARRR